MKTRMITNLLNAPIMDQSVILFSEVTQILSTGLHSCEIKKTKNYI